MLYICHVFTQIFSFCSLLSPLKCKHYKILIFSFKAYSSNNLNKLAYTMSLKTFHCFICGGFFLVYLWWIFSVYLWWIFFQFICGGFFSVYLWWIFFQFICGGFFFSLFVVDFFQFISGGFFFSLFLVDFCQFISGGFFFSLFVVDFFSVFGIFRYL